MVVAVSHAAVVANVPRADSLLLNFRLKNVALAMQAT